MVARPLHRFPRLPSLIDRASFAELSIACPILKAAHAPAASDRIVLGDVKDLRVERVPSAISPARLAEQPEGSFQALRFSGNDFDLTQHSLECIANIAPEDAASEIASGTPHLDQGPEVIENQAFESVERIGIGAILDRPVDLDGCDA